MPKIALYVCPQTRCSSLSMAMDAFALANSLCGRAEFELQRFSLDGQAVEGGGLAQDRGMFVAHGGFLSTRMRYRL